MSLRSIQATDGNRYVHRRFNDAARAFFRRNGFSPYIERLWNR